MQYFGKTQNLIKEITMSEVNILEVYSGFSETPKCMWVFVCRAVITKILIRINSLPFIPLIIPFREDNWKQPSSQL